MLLSHRHASGVVTSSSLQEEEQEAETISILSGFDRGSFSTVGMVPQSISKLLEKDAQKYQALVDG